MTEHDLARKQAPKTHRGFQAQPHTRILHEQARLAQLVPRLHTTASHYGFTPWLHTMASHHGFIPWLHAHTQHPNTSILPHPHPKYPIPNCTAPTTLPSRSFRADPSEQVVSCPPLVLSHRIVVLSLQRRRRPVRIFHEHVVRAREEVECRHLDRARGIGLGGGHLGFSVGEM
jgi:hypothetical protein